MDIPSSLFLGLSGVNVKKCVILIKTVSQIMRTWRIKHLNLAALTAYELIKEENLTDIHAKGYTGFDIKRVELKSALFPMMMKIRSFILDSVLR